MNGAGFEAGGSVTFSGTATDLEDGTLTANLEWSSSLDGFLGSGGSVTRTDLADGSERAAQRVRVEVAVRALLRAKRPVNVDAETGVL